MSLCILHENYSRAFIGENSYADYAECPMTFAESDAKKSRPYMLSTAELLNVIDSAEFNMSSIDENRQIPPPEYIKTNDAAGIYAILGLSPTLLLLIMMDLILDNELLINVI